jgi:predicted amidophosphoribosyltransferase
VAIEHVHVNGRPCTEEHRVANCTSCGLPFASEGPICPTCERLYSHTHEELRHYSDGDSIAVIKCTEVHE